MWARQGYVYLSGYSILDAGRNARFGVPQYTHTTMHACAHVRGSHTVLVTGYPAGHSISVESENPLSPFSRVVAAHRFIVQHSYGCSLFIRRLQLVILRPVGAFKVLQGLVKCRSIVVVAAKSPPRRSWTALGPYRVFDEQSTKVSFTTFISWTCIVGYPLSL